LRNITKIVINTSLFKKGGKLNQKVLTFLFFLALASLFWLLNTLDHTYTTNINYPIRYIHQMPNKEMVGNIPDELNLVVNGQGYALLRSIFTSNQHPVVFKVMSLPFNEISKDSGTYFILTKQLKEAIQVQFGNEITISYINPDTLYFTFSPITHKKLPVEPNVNLAFEQQYMQAGNVYTRPDSVMISGPQAVLDTIKQLKTQFQNFSNVNKSFSTDIKLQSLGKAILQQNTVKIFVPVDKYTEAQVSVPIKAINIPDSFHIKTFPANVTVSFDVTLHNYKRVSPKLFRAVVDYKSLDKSLNNKLKINLERQPTFVKNVIFRPKSIDFIIEK
jgi:YbbR domain-containing protein